MLVDASLLRGTLHARWSNAFSVGPTLFANLLSLDEAQSRCRSRLEAKNLQSSSMNHSSFLCNAEKSCGVITVKTFLLLLSALSVHLSLSPPNPAVKRDECYSREQNTCTAFERSVRSITFCSKSMVWFGVLVEIWAPTIRYMKLASQSTLTDPQYTQTGGESDWMVHPLLIFGVMLTALATLLRIWCFKTLGPLFTFEITIRPSHELITTGPYGWVRHPSYTGVYCTLIGASLALSAPQNWITKQGLWTWPGFLMACLWCVKCAFAIRGTSLRLKAEDMVLKETFGDEWESYAERVPWKLLPGLF